MDLDNQHQEGNAPESLPERKSLTRQQRYRLNKKLRKQQAQSNEAQNNQPQNNQPQGNQPRGNQSQGNQSQGNQTQSSQTQKKAPGGKARRRKRPPTKFVKDPPAWYIRVSKSSWFGWNMGDDAPDRIFTDEAADDLSEWQCDCNEDPEHCECEQTKLIVRCYNDEDEDDLNESFLDFQRQRNDVKRRERIYKWECDQEKARALGAIPGILENEKAKVAEIQAAISDIVKSKAPNAKKPVNVNHRMYDLYCVELCELVKRDGDGEGNVIYFVTRRDIEDMGPYDDPECIIELDSVPKRCNPGTKLYAMVALYDVVHEMIEWCSKPFPNPTHAGECSINRYHGGKGECMEIIIHNNEYLELKVSAKAVLDICDGDDKKKFNDYFNKEKKAFFHMYGVYKDPKEARKALNCC